MCSKSHFVCGSGLDNTLFFRIFRKQIRVSQPRKIIIFVICVVLFMNSIHLVSLRPCSCGNSDQETWLHASKPKWSKSAVLAEGLSWLSRQEIHL